MLRGRQRTRAERLASWRVGDRHRGWASVWALHDHPQLTGLVYRLSPHPPRGQALGPGALPAPQHLGSHTQLTGLVYRLSPHPRSGPVRDKNSPMQVVTTGPQGHRGR
ncbi:hypothetical protein MAHJHV55_54830 [Mycobacterium avium subsp. hominissuis]